jgi:multidrug resistance efflux pump
MDNKENMLQCEKNNVSTGAEVGTKEHSSAKNVKLNRVLKLISSPFFTPVLYSLAGILVFAFLIFIIAFHVLFLKVETAVISTPIETIVAPANGYIAEIYVRLGEKIKKGAPLFKIENFDLERDLNLARVSVLESKLKADYYQKLIINEQQRLKIYKQIGHNRVISRKTSLNIAKQEVLVAQHNLARYAELYKKYYVSQAIWEGVQAQYLSAQEKVKNSQAKHRMERHSLNALDQGMYFTGSKTEGIERDLYAELEVSQKRTTLSEERVKVYEHLIKKLTILAPFDGKVTQILKSAGNTTDTINPIIFIENTQENKIINAYLTQDEVMKIGTSKKVKIYIPSSGTTYHGNIIEINRTDGFIDAMNAQYRWRDLQIDRSAMVSIEIQQDDKKEFDKKTSSGMPAIVYFSKNVTL